MVSPPARNELLVLIRYSGSWGIAAFSFAASAWKLFQIAIILLGWVGVSSLTADSASVRDVASGLLNISPWYTVIVLPCSLPKPDWPACSKRSHLSINICLH